MEKTEIINKLYGIRAALSLISKIKKETEDDIAKKQKEVDSNVLKISKEIDSQGEHIESTNAKIKELTNRRDKLKKNLKAEEIDRHYEYDYEGCYDSYGEVLMKFWKFWEEIDESKGVLRLILHLLVCLAGGIVVASLGYPFGANITGTFGTIPGIVRSAFVALGCLIGLFFVLPLFYSLFYICVFVPIARARRRSKNKKDSIKYREHANQQYEKSKEELEKVEKELEEARAKAAPIVKEAKDKIDAQNKEISKLKNDGGTYAMVSTNSMKTISMNIHEAAVKEYGDVLDSRDWKYLDYIIFVFETGRADTIKEALGVLDQRIQTNEIIESIGQATAVVSSQISRSSKEICQYVSISAQRICDTTLNSAIATVKAVGMVNQSVIGLSGDVANLQSSVNTSMTKLVNTQSMTNALIEQSNVSSERLVKDYEYINNLRMTR